MPRRERERASAGQDTQEAMLHAIQLIEQGQAHLVPWTGLDPTRATLHRPQPQTRYPGVTNTQQPGDSRPPSPPTPAPKPNTPQQGKQSPTASGARSTGQPAPMPKIRPKPLPLLSCERKHSCSNLCLPSSGTSYHWQPKPSNYCKVGPRPCGESRSA